MTLSESISVVDALRRFCFLRKARTQEGMEQSISERMWSMHAMHLSKSRIALRRSRF